MARLTKQQSKFHLAAMDLVHSDRPLTFEQRFFILENYSAMATNNVTQAGAFFTPLELCNEFDVYARTHGSLVDLCAGIGSLSFVMYYNSLAGGSRKGQLSDDLTRVTCVELNPEYVEVGKRIFPEATWICGSALDQNLLSDIGKFDSAISNPPFGNIKSEDGDWLRYKGGQFHLKIIEVASWIADSGTFIIPFGFCNYDTRKNKYVIKPEMEKYREVTGIELFPESTDCRLLDLKWNGAVPDVEIVSIYDYEKPGAIPVQLSLLEAFA